MNQLKLLICLTFFSFYLSELVSFPENQNKEESQARVCERALLKYVKTLVLKPAFNQKLVL